MIKSNKSLKIINLFFLSSCITLSSCKEAINENDIPTPKESSEAPQVTPQERTKKINVALLLDTSNSMDGLIEQAKSQLWKIINQITKANKEGEEADIKIALYEYGNDNLVVTNGFVRQ